MEGFEKFVSGRRAPEAAGFTNIPCLAFYADEKRWEVVYYYANPLDKRKENKKAHWTTYTEDHGPGALKRNGLQRTSVRFVCSPFLYFIFGRLFIRPSFFD